MSNAPLTSPLGICGKIPGRGDFLAQGLPVAFLDSWNEWLQAVMAVSKEQLDENWLDCYLTSPVWHFALSAGVCGESGVAGTLIPSVDIVGRHYPFSIAKEVAQVPLQMWSKAEWDSHLEEWILRSLDDDFDLTDWLQKIADAEIIWPTGQPFNVAIRSDKSGRPAIKMEWDNQVNLLELLHQSYRDQFDHYCLWWTQGSEHVLPCLLVTSGLPRVSQFSAMLDGNWSKWGWQSRQLIG